MLGSCLAVKLHLNFIRVKAVGGKNSKLNGSVERWAEVKK
jgi:hypothetical protein